MQPDEIKEIIEIVGDLFGEVSKNDNKLVKDIATTIVKFHTELVAQGLTHSFAEQIILKTLEKKK